MIVSHDRHTGIEAESGDHQALVGREATLLREPEERHIHLSSTQRRAGFCPVEHGEGNVDLGPACFAGFENRPLHEHPTAVGANAESRLRGHTHSSDSAIQLTQDQSGIDEEGFSGRREDNATTGAREEGGPEFSLQCPDLGAEDGLADTHRLRRTGEVHCLGHGHEVLDLTDPHCGLLRPINSQIISNKSEKDLDRMPPIA